MRQQLIRWSTKTLHGKEEVYTRLTSEQRSLLPELNLHRRLVAMVNIEQQQLEIIYFI